MNRIFNHSYIISITKISRSVFLYLNLLSLIAILKHYCNFNLFDACIPYVTYSFPLLITGLLCNELFESKFYIIIGVLLNAFQLDYFFAFMIPLFLYFISKGIEIIKSRHILHEHQFIEDSSKDQLILIAFIMLMIGFKLLPDFHIQLPILNHPLFMVFIVLINTLCFYHGYHPNIIHFLIYPIEYLFLFENIIAFYTGNPLAHLFTHGSMSALCNLSGTGITIGIALLEHQLPKGTIKSAFFGVNEPVIFGLPITRNKKAFIPFVLGGTLLGAIPIYCMYLGYLSKPVFDAPYLGLGLEGFLVTLDYRVFIINFIQILLSLVIWYPYYKKEKQNEV